METFSKPIRTFVSPFAAVFVGAGALLIAWPAIVEAFNPQPEPPGHAIGFYRGYSQSEINPAYHPYMELILASEDDRGRLFGVLTVGSPVGDVRFSFRGKRVDDQGGFKGRGFDPLVGEVTFEGVIQAVGQPPPDDTVPPPDDGIPPPDDNVPPPDDTTPPPDDQRGALVRARYQFTDVAGNVDRGTTLLLRSFDTCVDCAPPELTGEWMGRTMSRLAPRGITLTLSITGQDGASFTGIAAVLGVEPEPFLTGDGAIGTLGIEPQPFSWSVVGTIGQRGNVVLIGVGDLGFVEAGAGYSPPNADGGAQARIRGTYSDGFVTGARDVGTFDLAPARSD